MSQWFLSTTITEWILGASIHQSCIDWEEANQ